MTATTLADTAKARQDRCRATRVPKTCGAFELATLRMWRDMGDTEGVNRCWSHIDDMLDRLQRYTQRDQPTDSPR